MLQNRSTKLRVLRVAPVGDPVNTMTLHLQLPPFRRWLRGSVPTFGGGLEPGSDFWQTFLANLPSHDRPIATPFSQIRIPKPSMYSLPSSVGFWTSRASPDINTPEQRILYGPLKPQHSMYFNVHFGRVEPSITGGCTLRTSQKPVFEAPNRMGCQSHGWEMYT